MSPRDALALVFERFSAFISLWSFFATVSVGLLALLARGTPPGAGDGTRYVMIAVFVGFAFCHAPGLWAIAEQWAAAAAVAKTVLRKQEFADTTEAKHFGLPEKLSRVKLNPPPIRTILFTHCCFDVFVCVAIWFLLRPTP